MRLWKTIIPQDVDESSHNFEDQTPLSVKLSAEYARPQWPINLFSVRIHGDCRTTEAALQRSEKGAHAEQLQDLVRGERWDYLKRIDWPSQSASRQNIAKQISFASLPVIPCPDTSGPEGEHAVTMIGHISTRSLSMRKKRHDTRLREQYAVKTSAALRRLRGAG